MNLANTFLKENKITINTIKNLKVAYHKQIDKSSDIEYTHDFIKKEFEKSYREIQNKYSPYNWEFINNIEDLIKRNKNLNLEKAICILTKKEKNNGLTEIIKKIATIIGYYYFSKYINEKNKNFDKNDIEKNKNFDENDIENFYSETEKDNSDIEKIEWLGTQKELGELFLILKEKKWIKEINPILIKKCFSKSDTIQQILKPSLNKDSSVYDGVYTKTYKPKFDLIRTRPIKPAKKK